MLYKILPNAPRAQMDPTKATPSLHADGVINSIFNHMTSSNGKVSLLNNTNSFQTKTQTTTLEDETPTVLFTPKW